MDDEICSIVLEQTDGNIFLMVEFLSWLHDRGLLTTNCPLSSGTTFSYWTWNIGDIQCAIKDSSKANSVNASKYYVSDKLGRLPMEMIDVLKVCACFGCSHMEDTLIEYVLNYPVDVMLSEAVEMGILHTLDYDMGGLEGKMYSFEHDSLQMAAYNLIPGSNRELFHLEIGRRLWRRLSKTALDQNIFVV
jgi:predicted ATPase